MRTVAAVLACLLGACAAPAPDADAQASPLGALPATFMGTLPCADCPGIEEQLNLLPDGVYHLRREYLERGVFDETGRWSLAPDQPRLELTNDSDGDPVWLAVMDATTLRQLDRRGEPIDSPFNTELRRQAAFAPIGPRP